jgi:nucleotide-binding universal stress UspA family protein
MSNIVCATRAGEGSRAVQMAAIDHARGPDKQLTFLYIIDVTSLGEVDDMIAAALREEMMWMGKTLLRIAERRAADANLTVSLVIREGAVRDEICQFVTEARAELLLLGAPRDSTANIFGDDEIETFAGSIQATTGVPVKIVRPESIATRTAAKPHSPL